MVSAHPHTIDTTRQPPKLGDFFSPYQQQQQQPSLNNYDNISSNNNGYENNNINLMQGHRPQSVTNLPLRQQNQNNALARQSQQNRRSPLLNANSQQQFINSLGRPPPLMASPTGFLNQENPQQLLQQNRSNSQNSIPKNPKLYKTELCRSWMDHGRCNYGERCQYAHGTDEKRQIPRHPKYKTEACSSYHKTGYCPYGPRCHFIHNEDPALLQQLIAQNAAAMSTVGSEQSSPTLTPTTQRPRNLNLQQTMSAPPSTVGTPQQGQQGQHQACQRQYSTILPIGSRPSLPQTPSQQQYFVQKQLGSDGESPIPSSTTDSGSESPLGSFSPGLEESLCRLSPTSFRRSLSHTGPTTRWSPTSGLQIFSPSTGTPATTNSSAAVAGNVIAVNVSGGGGIFGCPNDPWNDSSLINSLTSLSFGGGSEHHTPTTPIDNPWESKVAAARLPVFERLSNNL